MAEKYDHAAIEKKWQERWEKSNAFAADDTSAEPKKYVLDMFPYPSGEGLHVGHPKGYIATDIYSRHMRMKGHNVLHPMGWDAFGLPAENYALKNKIHPRVAVEQNIATFKAQLAHIGFDYDWSREINTTDPSYYKWTQWIFLQLFKKGLAFQSNEPINWCPSCMTGLANEDLDGAACERCGTVVEKKKLPQWVLKITAYADRMLADLDALQWPEHIKEAQRNWIGRSEGINITYEIVDSNERVVCFTTTPVNFGATFIVLAPEHPLVFKITTKDQSAAVVAYVEQARSKDAIERAAQKEKTGVFTGAYALNHVTGKQIPIWVADFALADVGTGAVQGCPGHDMRDFEFAKKYGIAIPRVVVGMDGNTGPIDSPEKVIEKGTPGKMINSDFLDGLEFSVAMEKTKDYFESKGWGKKVVNYKLKDWVFSRQRYWGEPIPIVHCPKDGAVAVPEKDLPVLLPEVKSYEPSGTGESPLAAITDWVNTTCPMCGGPAKRETNTMPQWAGSSWYYLRFMDPHNDAALVGKDKEKYWAPVDVYVGGDHAVRHLIYARFWHKFLYDIDMVSTIEPFARLEFLGFILAEDGRKMSKRYGNVINPDDVVKQYGADAFRLYEMFMGPFENTTAWNTASINGVSRFVERVWRAQELVQAEDCKALERLLEQTVKKIGEDIEAFKFNTAVSQMMILLNAIEKEKTVGKNQWKKFLQLLTPFAPHIAHELAEKAGWNREEWEQWPTHDPAKLAADVVKIAVQINGKVRATIELAPDAPEAEALMAARAAVEKWLAGGEKKAVYVPGKIVNLVVPDAQSGRGAD